MNVAKTANDLKGFMIYYDEFRYIMKSRSIAEKGLLFDSLYNWFETGKEPSPFSDPWLECDYYRLRDCIEITCKKYRQRKKQSSVQYSSSDIATELSEIDTESEV